MPLVDRCILHFGLAKTGSSALQGLMHHNKANLLSKYKILYPGSEVQHWHLHSICASQPDTLLQIQRKQLATPEAIDEFVSGLRTLLLDEIRACGASTVVFSSEYLVAMSEAELEKLNDLVGFIAEEVEAIFFVRDPWSYSTSFAQEMIRNGYLGGDRLGIGYAKGNIEIIDKIQKCLAAKFTVFPYLGGSSVDTTKVFLEHIGVAPADLEMVAGYENPSMDRRAACLLLYFNSLYPQFDMNGRYIADPIRDWCVEAILRSAPTIEPLTISRQRADQILSGSYEDLKRIQDTFLGGEPVYFDYFERLNFSNIDDFLGIDKLEQNEIANLMFKALYEMAGRAHEYRNWAIVSEAKLESLLLGEVATERPRLGSLATDEPIG